METAKLIEMYGNCHTFTVPSGYEVTIREQNGNDDGILSNVSLNKDSASVNAFIQTIVVGVSFKEGLLSMDDVLGLRLGDKYCILIQSRIFSLGNTLKFSYEWVKGAPPTSYEEDLLNFVWDYTLPLPRPGEKGYFVDRIQPYASKEDYLYLTTMSGKKLRYKYLDGFGEQYLLKLPDYNTNINSKLYARELQMDIEGKWITVSDFKLFSAREMNQLRDDIDARDAQFEGAINVENPATGETRYISLISLHDFFFQRGI